MIRRLAVLTGLALVLALYLLGLRSRDSAEVMIRAWEEDRWDEWYDWMTGR